MAETLNLDKYNTDACFGFTNNDGYDTLYFDNGHLTASAQSYQIDGVGEVELTKEQTYQIYLKMKAWYESLE